MLKRGAEPMEKQAETGRGSVTVTVVSQEQYDHGLFNFGCDYEDGSLQEVIDSLLGIAARIPEEFRSAARCKIDSVLGYEDSTYASIEVTFRRPETDEEWGARIAKAERKELQEEAKARRDYELLKQRFEGA